LVGWEFNNLLKFGVDSPMFSADLQVALMELLLGCNPALLDDCVRVFGKFTAANQNFTDSAGKVVSGILCYDFLPVGQGTGKLFSALDQLIEIAGIIAQRLKRGHFSVEQEQTRSLIAIME